MIWARFSFIKRFSFYLIYFNLLCSWCIGYRGTKWIRRQEFKSNYEAVWEMYEPKNE